MLDRNRLPEGWKITNISKVGKITTGNTPPKKDPANYGYQYPWVKPSELDKDVPITETEEKLSEQGASFARLVPKDTVLVSCIGILGKVGFAGTTLATNQQINAITFNKDAVEPKYGYFYCKTLKKWLDDNSSATTIKIVNKRRFSEAPFPIPPLAEQHRIVAAIEALFARLDAAQVRLEKVPGIVQQFRQAVLAAACDGRLTEDWRLEAENEYDYKIEIFEVKNYQYTIELFKIPESWQWTHIESVVNSIQYGSSDKAYSELENGIPILRMGNIQNGALDLSDLKYIPKETKDVKSFLLEKGDVLFNRTNSPELVGKSACVNSDLKAVFASYIIRMRPNPDFLLGNYLCWWINSPWGREWAKKVRTDGVSQSNINSKKLKAMPIPLPPLPEQEEIVSRIDALFALANQIDGRIIVANERINTLRQSILTQAFSGQLVPIEAELARREGRDYEPAAMLLEQIHSK